MPAKITVDHRELRSKVAEYLRSEDIEIAIVNGQTADYIVGGRIAIERKTIIDFISSIRDKRIFEQTKTLKANYFRKLIILEGGGLYIQRTKLSSNAIRGVLIWISVNMGVPVIRTYNEKDTAAFISLIARKLTRQYNAAGHEAIRKRELSFSEKQTAVLSSIKGIGPLISRNLICRFATIESLVQAEESELCHVPGVGRKKAEQIKKILTEHSRTHLKNSFKSFPRIFRAKNPEIEEE